MKKRYSSVDVAKGIGAILVVLGHAGVQGFPRIILYSFHMPLFFFLSGLFLRYDTKHRFEFIKKRMFGILMPYFLFYLLILAKEILLLVVREKTMQSIWSVVLGMLLQMRNTEFGGKLWFLPVIFQGSILCGVSEEFVVRFHRKSLRFVFATMYFIGGYACITLRGKALLWNFDAALIAASFMITGLALKDLILTLLENESKKYLLLMSVGLIGNILLASINYRLTGRNSDLYWMVIGNPILYVLAGYFGIVAVIFFSGMFNSKVLAFIGRNSLLFYCLHHEFVFPIAKAVIPYLPYQKLASYYLTVLSCMIIIPLCILINKYMPWFSGKIECKKTDDRMEKIRI